MNQFIKALENSLPPVEYSKLRTEADCYGISRLISQQFHAPFTPLSFSSWLHGWMYVDLKYIEQFGLISNDKYLLATKEQEYFFKERGKNAKAVGAPYIYAELFDKGEIKRQSNSLIVMPPHGLPYTTEQWDEEVYVKQIADLKNDFDSIVACVHPSCAEKNNWIVHFERYDIPWITGADMRDKNALIRMHRIFQSFDYMTTNCIGSHVAYAAYSGCKVSIYGNFAEFSKEDVKDDVLYVNYPHVMDHNLQCSTKQAIYNKFPFLFVHPKMASQHKEWAFEQLGAINKVSNFELAWQLGWLPPQQLYYWAAKIYKKLKKEFLRMFS